MIVKILFAFATTLYDKLFSMTICEHIIPSSLIKAVNSWLLWEKHEEMSRQQSMQTELYSNLARFDYTRYDV